MENWFAWGGLAAVAAVVGGAWRQIRSFYDRCTRLIFRQVEVGVVARASVVAYLNKHAKPAATNVPFLHVYVGRLRSSFATRYLGFIGSTEKATALYWFRGRPLWLSADSASSDNSPQSSSSSTEPSSTLTFIRGTLDIDQFLCDVVDDYNGRRADEFNRFYVSVMTGSFTEYERIRERSDGPRATDTPSKLSYDSSTISEKVRLGLLRPVGFPAEELTATCIAGHNTLDLLALSDDAKLLIEEVGHWLQHRKWFESRDMPWQFGCLLEGPPGCGKSSFIRGIGERFQLPVLRFDLATFDNADMTHRWKMATANAPTIVVFEDFDNVFEGRKTLQGGVSFDSLLQCISGVDVNSGILLFITTNRRNCLDSALGGVDEHGRLSRPGRIDRVLHFGPPTRSGLMKIASRMLAEVPDEIYNAVEAGVADGDTGAQFKSRCYQIAVRRYREQQQGAAREQLAAEAGNHHDHASDRHSVRHSRERADDHHSPVAASRVGTR